MFFGWSLVALILNAIYFHGVSNQQKIRKIGWLNFRRKSFGYLMVAYKPTRDVKHIVQDLEFAHQKHFNFYSQRKSL